jgi:hypothetical protein
MNTVLILNHRVQSCGVYQSGKRIYKLMSDSDRVNFIYREAESEGELDVIVGKIKPNFIFYNWHQSTMPWLTKDIVNRIGIPAYYYFHTQPLGEDTGTYLFFGAYALDRNILPEDKMILMPRPLLNYTGEYRENSVVTIGSFGFTFWHKGFHTLVELVNSTFEKAIINLHLTQSHFGYPTGDMLRDITAECERLNTNPNIILNITHDFRDDLGILEFLSNNDINVFMYGDNGEGLSGVPDYALSVKRPIAISDCTMFRHFSKDEIRLDKHSIQEILEQGTKPLEEFYDRWSTENFVKEMENLFI